MIFKLLMISSIFSFLSFSNMEEVPVSGKKYETVKTEINMERKKWKALYDSARSEKEKKKIISDAGQYLLKNLTGTMFPYWYGTKWDFNGYTDKPGEGEIACGYFVSTTLKHCGFNLNRFKLAQSHSFGIVKSLNTGDSLISFRGISSADLIAKTKNKLKDGLYAVGLDYHVGFLFYEKGEIYFIHANYRSPVAVVKEKASESPALKDSRVFIMCSITGNEKLIKKWLAGSLIEII